MITERDAKHFGRILCEVRRQCGYSQERLAARAGLARDTVYKIEAGERSPQLHTLLALADALGVDPRELLRGMRP